VSVTAYHSFGGEVEASKHPHDTPPYPFMPSPTFSHSSPAAEAPDKGILDRLAGRDVLDSIH